ncbi:MAG: hypothetical protein EAZ47_10740 [Bacteroidetes bacterium]|nr:MAG: hypothetical protein EAY72_07070 [Bacteroidota bacterium]TAE72765.1 MAG: hypothetical protein EAY68_00365 [Bacteroidota bacterium]TAF90805.1 MAG: hypothetical protein EAZ47_10740 [Bacteroidota bacterium]
MKKLMIISAFLLGTVATVFAQSEKYYGAMGANLAGMGNLKTVQDHVDLAAKFERIGDAEKTQWLPYYYAALLNSWAAFAAPNTEKDALGNKAKELVNKAQAIQNSSELYAVKYMASTAQMMVDPMTRWQVYGQEAQKALDEGFALDAKNPRLHYMQGQSLFNTPEAFGGGKAKAKASFEKAVALYNEEKPASPIAPTWGKEQAASMLEKCNK